MAYQYGEREQAQLFPASLDEYVGADDPVRVYDAFVDALNFAELGIVVDDRQVGPPEFDPRAMVKLLVYGYAYGIRGSRKLERATYHNVSFMWLMGGLRPDHKTIARFRKDQQKALRQILRQCVRLCMKLGLIEGNTLFVDGTKIRANAGMRQSWSDKRCERVLKETDAHIDRILKDCDRLDEQESESLMKVAEDLQSAQALKAKVQAIAHELEQRSTQVFNTTDPDCRHMQSRQGAHAAYNVQMVVDDKHGLIVQGDAVQDVNDRHQLEEQVAESEKALGQPIKTVCADTGYDHNASWKKLEERQVAVIVKPNPQYVPGPFTKDQFPYNPAQDTYLCPRGQTMTYYRTDKNNGHRLYTTAKGVCQGCPQFGICTTNRAGRMIARMPYEEIRPIVKRRFESPEGQRIYARRDEKVEHPFGHIKRNLGVQSFLMRGLAGVRAEVSIFASCFNLARLITLLGHQTLITKLQAI